MILTIEVDGVGTGDAGIDAARTGGPRSGLGVRTMRHRARMIGATLTFEPGGGGGGTIVACTVSARQPAAAETTTAMPLGGGRAVEAGGDT